MLDFLIDETIEQIRKDVRHDGLDMPIDASRAARQAIGEHLDPASPAFLKVWQEVWELQVFDAILPDNAQLATTSLADLIGLLARQRMGSEYDDLREFRRQVLTPGVRLDLD